MPRTLRSFALLLAGLVFAAGVPRRGSAQAPCNRVCDATLRDANGCCPATAPPRATPPPPCARSGATTPQPAPAVTGLQRVSRAVAFLERDGRVLGLGTVLDDPHRPLLTALSVLGGSEVVDVRYADGSLVRARVAHLDAAWDLALVVPLCGRWEEGLGASSVSPATADVKSVLASRPPIVVGVHVQGPVDVRGRGGESLNGALACTPGSTSGHTCATVPSGGSPVGAPIVDGDGGMVGVVVSACRAGAAAPAAACSSVVVVAPISAIRHFLGRTPANAFPAAPWLGIVGVTETGATHGVRVSAVAPNGPAAQGGLAASEDRTRSDLIVAADSLPVDTLEHLAELIARHVPGDVVKLLVLGPDGRFRDVVITLRAAP